MAHEYLLGECGGHTATVFLTVILLAQLAPRASTTPIDNGIVDPINIQCSSRSVKITFNTQKPWKGTLFVQNYFDNPKCRVLSADAQRSFSNAPGVGNGQPSYQPPPTGGGGQAAVTGSANMAMIELPFDGPCGVKRDRSVSDCRCCAIGCRSTRAVCLCGRR